MLKHKRVLVINKQWVLQEQNDEGKWKVVKMQPALNLVAGYYDLSKLSFPQKNKKYIGNVLYTDEEYIFFQSQAEQNLFKIKSSLFKKTVSVGDQMCLKF